jgi:DNA-binding MarR family transcriptional regulator
VTTVDAQPDVQEVAGALRTSIGLLHRRFRQSRPAGELTLPESSALTRLDRHGPTTPSALARLEQISPQSMGATLAALERRGLVERRSDPEDRRRAILLPTDAGRQLLQDKRSARTAQLAQALASEFTRAEIEHLRAAAPLLERLAHSI